MATTSSKEHETTTTAQQPSWGTLEELLLVCAVNRHGTKSWDSVATEVQSRTTTAAAAVDCRDKFDDLKRRFLLNNAAVAEEEGEEESSLSSSALAPVVDELRRLRVEELRRDVRRQDVSIVSLELKVKTLEEERDRRLKDVEATTTAAAGDDLQRGGGGESEKLVVGKSNSGEGYASDSDYRENRSFNESNSTSQRSDAKQNGVVVEKKTDAADESDPVMRTETRSEPDHGGKVIDTVDVDLKNESDEAKPPGRPGDNELVVKGEERGTATTTTSAAAAKQQQQNSDVQSSASLSRKRKRRRKGGGGGESSSGEEPEGGEEISPATTKRVKLVKHEPLVKVLRIVRSHQLGSVFERRLRSQESQRYRNLIREHVDLHVVQSKLDKGAYKDCTHKFFRDLLLVFNNAVVFFRKATPEHAAALELRSIVLKEMNHQLSRRQSSVSTVKPNVESDITTTTTTTSARPGKSSTIVVCGKRGSINALSENKKGSNVRKVKAEVEEKASEKKVDDIAPVKNEEKSGVRKIRTGGGRSRKTAVTNVEVKTKQQEYGGNELSAHDGLEEVKTEKKEEGKKKQGAASFLKRIKQNGLEGKVAKSSDGSEDKVKDSMVEEEEEDEEEEEVDDKKKMRSTTGRKKSDVEKKPRVTRSANGNRGRRGGRGQESGGRGKRGVGRPPKKPETSAAGSGKRGRDTGEADQVGSSGRPRKRTRR